MSYPHTHVLEATLPDGMTLAEARRIPPDERPPGPALDEDYFSEADEREDWAAQEADRELEIEWEVERGL